MATQRLFPSWRPCCASTTFAPSLSGMERLRARLMRLSATFCARRISTESFLSRCTVPPLPYAYDALEPHIDKATMEFHHDKHHQAYVDKANAALEGTALADAAIEDVLKDLSQVPEEKRGAV